MMILALTGDFCVILSSASTGHVTHKVLPQFQNVSETVFALA